MSSSYAYISQNTGTITEWLLQVHRPLPTNLVDHQRKTPKLGVDVAEFVIGFVMQKLDNRLPIQTENMISTVVLYLQM